MELLKRNGSNRAPDPTGYLTARKTNKIRHREELCLRFFVTKGDLEGGRKGEREEKREERHKERRVNKEKEKGKGERGDKEGRRKERG